MRVSRTDEQCCLCVQVQMWPAFVNLCDFRKGRFADKRLLLLLCICLSYHHHLHCMTYPRREPASAALWQTLLHDQPAFIMLCSAPCQHVQGGCDSSGPWSAYIQLKKFLLRKTLEWYTICIRLSLRMSGGVQGCRHRLAWLTVFVTYPPCRVVGLGVYRMRMLLE
jgi:hypothetical protein